MISFFVLLAFTVLVLVGAIAASRGLRLHGVLLALIGVAMTQVSAYWIEIGSDPVGFTGLDNLNIVFPSFLMVFQIIAGVGMSIATRGFLQKDRVLIVLGGVAGLVGMSLAVGQLIGALTGGALSLD